MDLKERHVHKGFLGHLTWDPDSPGPGEWWYNTRSNAFKFYTGSQTITLEPTPSLPDPPEDPIIGGTYVKQQSISSENLGRPNTNPPTVVDQDNLTLYRFTLNTDRMTYQFYKPRDYALGPIEFRVVWTNDGGGDDQNRNVTWQIQYQTGSEGDIISGNHANSPLWVNDTYTSGFGWVEHHTGWMAIPQADFIDEECVFIRLMAITPPAPALTSQPHLIGLCRRYTAQRVITS